MPVRGRWRRGAGPFPQGHTGLRRGYCVLGPVVERREGNSCLPWPWIEGVGRPMGILGAERCFRPEEGATLRPGMPPGPQSSLCFFLPALNPGRSCLKGVLPRVKKLLFTSRLLGDVIPESSWGMGGAEGKRLDYTDDSVKKPTPSLPSHSCPPPPPPPGPWLFSPRGLQGEQLGQ